MNERYFLVFYMGWKADTDDKHYGHHCVISKTGSYLNIDATYKQIDEIHSFSESVITGINELSKSDYDSAIKDTE